MKLFKILFNDNLKRATSLDERRARLEKVTGVKAVNWNKGKEFDQNKVTAGEIKVR
jgi:hypothetical protein